LLDQITIVLKSPRTGSLLPVYIEVYNNSLSRRWLAALNQLLDSQYHLEKNYCFLGFADNPRNPELLCDQINVSIAAINASGLDYHIDDHFTVDNTVGAKWLLDHNRMNHLHRYFEDLQGRSGAMSPHYLAADAHTRWHIRQLNLLCHEYESLILSIRKKHTAPEWQRPSQLMCWLNAPRFQLEPEDYELFGIETINREMGGVFVGVNKAVGKHHWEVFSDEGRDSRISELTTTSLATQTLACADFDIEWGQNPSGRAWQIQQLAEFRIWLKANGFDPTDPGLTIGHPKVAQVDLQRSFGTEDYQAVWNQLNTRLNVTAVRTSQSHAEYPYHWADPDYALQQIKLL